MNGLRLELACALCPGLDGGGAMTDSSCGGEGGRCCWRWAGVQRLWGTGARGTEAAGARQGGAEMVGRGR